MNTYKVNPLARSEIVDAMHLYISTGCTSYLKTEGDTITGINNLTGEIPVTELYRDIPDSFFAALAAVEELTPEIAEYWAVEKVIMSVTPNTITI